MDVATGASDVLLPRAPVTSAAFALLLLFFGAVAGARVAHAIGGEGPIHFSADKEIWDRKSNRVELFGHAAVRQPGEQITADYIILDQNAHTLDAYGNCIYVTRDSIITAEEMHFNLETRTGTIVGGRISNEYFSLAGERINKLGADRYQTHWGEYSTCRDCTQSWSLQAQDVDMQVEGYAYLSNVALKVKDTPALWLPYMIVPMKSRRQSGFLFPTLRFSSANGIATVVPYFWAIDRSADMTIAAGQWSDRGLRLDLEGRYALSDRSKGIARYFYLTDKQLASNSGEYTQEVFNPKVNGQVERSRWALDIVQSQELPYSIEQKLRFREVSDNLYPIVFPEDISNVSDPYLTSSLSFSRSVPGLSTSVFARRIRNLLDVDLDPTLGARRFDPKTVQLLPGVTMTSNDRLLSESLPLVSGVTVGLSNFTRSAGYYDTDPLAGASDTFRPGKDPIRTAARFNFSPSVYTTVRPWDLFAVTPSVRYNGYFYNFGNNVPNLFRGYPLLQTDISVQLERVYETENPDIPRIKHLVRPLLTYSFIPDALTTEDKDHAFIKQINYGQTAYSIGSQGAPRYYFDSYDLVPVDRPATDTGNYYVPLGNSLAYGFTTQVIRRLGRLDNPDSSYQSVFEFSAGQAVNFREFSKEKPQPLTRFFSTMNFLIADRLTSGTTYYYFPYVDGIKHQLSTSATYVIERSTRQGILAYDRSVTLGYSWNQLGCPGDGAGCGTNSINSGVSFSINDYILPTAGASYDFSKSALVGAGVGLTFQSPSRCWKFAITRNYSLATQYSWDFNFQINLTGAGFGGSADWGNQISAATQR